jgi:hypothetical protein
VNRRALLCVLELVRAMTGARTRARLGLMTSCGLALSGAVTLLVAGCGTDATAHRYSSQHAAGRAVTIGQAPPTLKSLAARYLLIARPANHRLDVEVDGYGDADHDDLTRARGDLRAEVATERWFDARLLRLPFPDLIARTARALVRANAARIALTERQAQAGTLAAMRRLDGRHRAADGAVEAQVRLIRVFLGLPPPSTS